MNPIVIEILKQVIIAVAGISIVGATVATGTLGATNLVSRFTQKDHKIAQVQADEIDPKSEKELTDSSEESKASGDIAKPKPTITQAVPAKKTGPTGMVTAIKPTSVVSAQNNTGCIITLSGQQYNVSSLQQSHSGGDIFNCGTDMTSVYQGKHGSSLTRMQKYLVSAIGTGSNSNSTGTTGTTGTKGINTDSSSSKQMESEHEESEDHEDREHEMEKTLEAAKKELEHEED